VVPDHVQERLTADELPGAVDSVPVSSRLLLRDETHGARVPAGGLGVACLITWPDNNTDLPNIRSEGLFDQDAKNGFLSAVVN